jgi:CheY-like chemotaxis protein
MRLLLVEDEPDLRRILTTSLREEGFAVDTAEEGEEGLRKALSHDYVLVVLDWVRPRLRSRQTGGYGLGLSKCQSILKLHHGEITSRSQLGQGSTITVRLPLTRL